MEFLDKLVLPHSGTTLELLKFLLILALIVFSIFSGVLLASTSLSFIFKKKFQKSKLENHRLLSRDFADLITGDKIMGVFLGVVPFLGIIMLYLQLLHETKAPVVNFLIFGFVFYLSGMSLIYIYKQTLHLNHFFKLFKDLGGDKFDEDTTRDVNEISNKSQNSNTTSPIWGLLFLFVSLWIFIAATSLAIDSGRWESSPSMFSTLFSFDSIIKFIHFLSISFATTGAAFIVKYFYWDKRDYPVGSVVQEGGFYTIHSKKYNAILALIFTLIQPIFFFIETDKFSFAILPVALIFTVLILVFILLQILYQAIKNNNFGAITYAFYILLGVFAIITVKEQYAFSAATKSHLEVLASKFEEQEANVAELGGGASDVNGKDIYEMKCTACHAFDKRLVGPPHHEVLEKYKNDKAGMVQFILHPKKVRPDYPVMPDQGLKPNEAKAVVEYMFKEYGDKLK